MKIMSWLCPPHHHQETLFEVMGLISFGGGLSNGFIPDESQQMEVAATTREEGSEMQEFQHQTSKTEAR
jgi:hypothetical protein